MSRPFNKYLHKIGSYWELPASADSLVVVLLKTTGLQAETTIIDHDTLADVFTAGNVEADFAGYVRKYPSAPTLVLSDTNDNIVGAFPDVLWSPGGSSTGGTNNTLGGMIVGYRADTSAANSAILPLAFANISITTDGTDFSIRTSNGVITWQAVQGT